MYRLEDELVELTGRAKRKERQLDVVGDAFLLAALVDLILLVVVWLVPGALEFIRDLFFIAPSLVVAMVVGIRRRRWR